MLGCIVKLAKQKRAKLECIDSEILQQVKESSQKHR